MEEASGSGGEEDEEGGSSEAFDGVLALQQQHYEYISGLKWAGGAGRGASLFTAAYDGSLRRLDVTRGVSGDVIGWWVGGCAGVGGSSAAARADGVPIRLLHPAGECTLPIPIVQALEAGWIHLASPPPKPPPPHSRPPAIFFLSELLVASEEAEYSCMDVTGDGR